jgi:hypothetical protein
MKRLALAALIASSFVVLHPVAGQETLVKPGSTIRILPAGDYRFHSGQLGRLTADSVILTDCPSCSRLLYGRAEVAKLDVYRTYARGEHIFYGTVFGAAIGGALGYLSAATCGGGDKCDLAGLAIPFGAISGAIVGSIVGIATAYKWQPVISSESH